MSPTIGAASDPPRVVFLIIDAFDPRRLSPRLTPNLWRWANADGAVSGTGRSVMASCTYPNHATFITGVDPARHGIHTNHVIRNGRVQGAWEVGPGRRTLFDALADFGTSAVLGDHHLVGVMGASAATSHWPPDGDKSDVSELDLLGYPADEAVLPLLLTELTASPALVVGYFGSIDTVSHVYGPESKEAEASYRSVDDKVALIDEAIRPGWQQTLLVVVSDHTQDTAEERPGIDLRPTLGEDAIVVDEGSAVLVAGESDPAVLRKIDGIEGWELLDDGSVLAWCEPGRFFGPFDRPILKGVHGGAASGDETTIGAGQRGTWGPPPLGRDGGGRPGSGQFLGSGDRSSIRPEALALLQGLDQFGQYFLNVTNDSEVGDREDRGVGILVDGDDGLGVFHPHQVLHCSGDATRDIDVRLHRLAGLPYLFGVRHPSGVDDGAGGTGGGLEGLGETLHQLITLGGAQPPTPGDDHRRLLELGTLALLGMAGGDIRYRATRIGPGQLLHRRRGTSRCNRWKRLRPDQHQMGSIPGERRGCDLGASENLVDRGGVTAGVRDINGIGHDSAPDPRPEAAGNIAVVVGLPEHHQIRVPAGHALG
jgi:hypothetical protein